MPDKVLIIDHGKDVAGGQRSLVSFLSLAKKNSRLGFVVLLNRQNTELQDLLAGIEIPFFCFDFSKNILIKFLTIPKAIFSINKKYRFKVFYGNTFEGGVWAIYLKYVFSKPAIFRARLAVDIHNHGFIDKFLVKHANLVFANSHYVKRSFENRFHLHDSDKIKVIYNPVPANPLGVIKAQQGPKEKFVFAIIGRIQDIKNQLEGVRAFELAWAQEKNIRLWLIGQPDVFDKGKYYQRLVEYVRERRLEDVVVFIPYVKKIEEILLQIDVAINCNAGEALSRSMFETQMAGIPNIAASGGGNIELITHEHTGLLYEAGNVEALSQNMLRLSHDRVLYQDISAASIKMVNEKFSLQQTVIKEINTINSLLSI